MLSFIKNGTNFFFLSRCFSIVQYSLFSRAFVYLFSAPLKTAHLFKTFKVCKYDPTLLESPFVRTFFQDSSVHFPMLLDELFFLQEHLDTSLCFRRSCREGICGSCAMNVNGVNTLACIFKTDYSLSANTVYPLAHMPIVRDLVVSLKHFYNQYKSIQPWIDCTTKSTVVNLQYQNQRFLLDGLYECILCACCSTSCPSYWWNSASYLGPAVLLQAFRWVVDSRDTDTLGRLMALNDTFKLFRCHSILNCSQACPKNLDPSRAIASLRILVSFLLFNGGF